MNDDAQSPKAAPARPSIGNPVARARAVWKGELLFEAGVGERTHLVDGNSKRAPSPVETLLGAVGTCAGSDVADILAKQRTPPKTMVVEVLGTRRPEHPRRVIAVETTFTIEGERIERAQAERAVALSIEKYCSVAASLAGDVEITTVVVLNGEAGQPVKQPNFNAAP
jgi:putative redox protein